MSELSRTLDLLRTRIEDYTSRTRPLNEADTINALIYPLLKSLGWDVHDPDLVSREYRHKGGYNPVDVALMSGGRPVLFIEAKALGSTVNDHKCTNQMLSYAVAANVKWCVITNGREWRVYNAQAPEELENKLLWSVDIMEDQESCERLFPNLSAGEIKPEGKLDRMWNSKSVDAKVVALFDGLSDDAQMLSYLARRVGISAKEFKDSLSRLRFRVDVEHSLPKSPEASALSERKSGEPRVKNKWPKIREMIERGMVQAGQVLSFKGEEATLLDDGDVLNRGQKMSLNAWAQSLYGGPVQSYIYVKAGEKTLHEIRMDF